MRDINRMKKGFSLIEVIISVAVLAILLIPIASVTISTVRRNAEAEDKQRANFEGQKLLEELKSYDLINLESDERDPLNVVETATLLNGKPLLIKEATTDPTTSIRDYKRFETNEYIINDGTGDLYAKVKIERNPDATYEDVTPYTINEGDYKQRLYFHSTAAGNAISLTTDTGGDFSNVETKSISNIDDVTVDDPDRILVLDIDANLGVRLLRRTFSNPDEIIAQKSSITTASDDDNNKILVKLDEGFNSSNVNLYVESVFDHALTIDIIKENNPTKKVEIKTTIVNPITGISSTKIKRAINVINNVSTYEQNKIGDLYTIMVEISRINTGKLFAGEAIKNIEINKTVIR